MKLLSTMAAGLLFSAFAAAPAFAEAGDNEITYISPSIIMIGTPDPCEDGGCEEDVAAVEEKKDNNAALVDAYGMPTSMPVIIRPSVDAPTAQAPADAAAAPAEPAATAEPAAPAAAEAPAAEAPATTAEAAPVAAPAEQAPANSNPQGAVN
jgi:pyruvate dehydrogenase E2 component (dihydrolipoamide acetyltransferase)